MNALTLDDLSLSQDLDRESLAAVIGAGYDPDPYYKYYVTGSWSGYYDGQTLVTYYCNNRPYKSQVRWTRQRTQWEYSYWNYWY